MYYFIPCNNDHSLIISTIKSNDNKGSNYNIWKKFKEDYMVLLFNIEVGKS